MIVCFILVNTHDTPSQRLWGKLAYLLTVVFPQDLLEKGLAANNFAMLGLGDIVIPGIFIALLLRFDVRLVFHTYFNVNIFISKIQMYMCAIKLKFQCMNSESRMFNIYI